MLLNFYVQGSSGSPPAEDDRDHQWFDFDSLTSMTFEDVKEKVAPFVESARSAFKYLRGDYIPVAMPPATTDKEKSEDGEKVVERSWWGVTDLFSGLRGRRSHDVGGQGAGATWTEGEVHADLVRVRQTISRPSTQPRYTKE